MVPLGMVPLASWLPFRLLVVLSFVQAAFSMAISILLQDYGGIVFREIWVALGYMLWSHRGVTAGQPSRVA